MTITEFLLARIAEEEQIANRLLRDLTSQIEDEGVTADDLGAVTPTRMLAADIGSRYRGQSRWSNVARGQYITALSDAARVLAECRAKRRIVEDKRRIDASAGDTEWHYGYSDGNYDAIRALAFVYADHPDYDPAWRV